MSNPVRWNQISDLSKEADDIPPIDHKIEIKKYYRSAITLLQQGKQYALEEDFENAYIMNLRYLRLIVEHLPKHKEYLATKATEGVAARKRAEAVMTEMEQLKKKLNVIYQAKEQEKNQLLLQKQMAQLKLQEEQRQMEIQRKQQEDEMRARQEYEDAQRRAQIFQQDDPSGAFSFSFLKQEIANQQKSQLAFERKTNPTASMQVPIPQQPWTPVSQPIPVVAPVPYEAPQIEKPQPSRPIVLEDDTDSSDEEDQPIPIDQSKPVPQISQPVLPQQPIKQLPPQQPQPIPTQMPVQEYRKAPPTPVNNSLVNGLRRIHMDVEMFEMFMDLAKHNTDRDIETCGILAGKMKNNVFYITQLIIPKQEGSSDKCHMTNEDEVFAHSIEEDLMTLGWIHTHPSHDLFLSSVDMHTHVSYQVLLKEAIAVVVAPRRRPNFGIFHLRDPYGVKTIQNCDFRGFHPHEQGLYTNCDHVVVNRGDPTYLVVDLR